MPTRRAAWSSWNAFVDPDPDAPCTVTYWMNRLQRITTPRPVFVSLNPGAQSSRVTRARRCATTRTRFRSGRSRRAARAASSAGYGWRVFRGRMGRLRFPRRRLRQRSQRRRRAAARSAETSCCLTGSAKASSATDAKQPVPHEFRYRIWMLLADVDRLDALAAQQPAVVRRPVQSVVDPTARVPRGLAGRNAFEHAPMQQCAPPDIRSATGPMLLLLQPASWGAGFNPVRFVFCLDESGRRIEFVLGEINNTPWGERHTYVLRADNPAPRVRVRIRQGLSRFAVQSDVAALSMDDRTRRRPHPDRHERAAARPRGVPVRHCVCEPHR